MAIRTNPRTLLDTDADPFLSESYPGDLQKIPPLTNDTKIYITENNSVNRVSQFILNESGASGFSGAAGASGISGFSGAAGPGVPGGSDTQVQFNNAGEFAGSSEFIWNNISNTLSVDGTVSTGPIHEKFINLSPGKLVIEITSFVPYYQISIVNGGSGFTNGQQFLIPGTLLGGISPDNDRILTISAVNGSITGAVLNNVASTGIPGIYNCNLVTTSNQIYNIYLLSSGVDAFTVNNVNLSTGTATNFLLVITQDATPVVPSSFNIDGVNVPLQYPNGTLLIGTANNTDVVNISVFKTGSSTYIAFAQISTFTFS